MKKKVIVTVFAVLFCSFFVRMPSVDAQVIPLEKIYDLPFISPGFS